MILPTVLTSTFVKLPPKKARYWNYKNFTEATFCHELDQILLQGEMYRSQGPYSKLTETISNFFEKHD